MHFVLFCNEVSHSLSPSSPNPDHDKKIALQVNNNVIRALFHTTVPDERLLDSSLRSRRGMTSDLSCDSQDTLSRFGGPERIVSFLLRLSRVGVTLE